ncbi:MAG: hypothetical protein EXR76_02580 [Myxococcales bacterium]|nr:hypothetical protein [Myxococcales bacterium]
MRGSGHDVTVFEGAPRAGGLASPWRIGDVVWDKFFHVILESDVHVHALLAELDLTEKVHRNKTRTGFYTDGVLHSMSDTVEFLKFPPLRLVDAYLETAIRACKLSGTPPSILLHPLDVLGGDQVPALRFFPGMDLDAHRKRDLFIRVMDRLKAHFELLPMNA